MTAPIPTRKLYSAWSRAGKVIAQLRQELHDREQRRYKAFQEALGAQLDVDELAELIFDKERFGDLLRDAVEAALRTHDETKIRMLATTFASGALSTDAASIDEAEQLLRVVAALDAVQLRALAAIRDSGARYGSPEGCLIHELKTTPAMANLLFHQLQQFGLVEVEQRATYDAEFDDTEVQLDTSWALSQTGQALARHLRNDQLVADLILRAGGQRHVVVPSETMNRPSRISVAAPTRTCAAQPRTPPRSRSPSPAKKPMTHRASGSRSTATS